MLHDVTLVRKCNEATIHPRSSTMMKASCENKCESKELSSMKATISLNGTNYFEKHQQMQWQ